MSVPGACPLSATILIVEDHPAVRTSLRSWLARALAGYEFAEAASGEEALALLGQQRPALVLMDINLPGMSGIETTRRLTAAVPGVPVVVVSMYDTEAHRHDAAAAGAAGFVAKERMGFELLPLLQRLLSPTAPLR